MTDAVRIQQAVIGRLKQLSSEKQQKVLDFVEALYTDSAGTDEWSMSAIKSSIADVLNNSEEDIYTLEDGEPIDDEG